MEPVSCAGCQALQRRLHDLQAENERLRRQLDEATRARKRQAAPFAKGQPTDQPKKPGRKPGKDYGTKAHRQPPAPDQIDEVHEAPLPDRCPDCGGPLGQTHIAQQFQVEIPRKPIHRQFNIHIGRCRLCQRRVQGRHPLQTSDALGAAAAQLGPDAQAAVGGHPAWLHTLVGPVSTAYVIDPTRSGAVAEAILGPDYGGTMIHDGWSPYDQFEDARHQQCLNHLLRRAHEMAATATRGAVCFPRRVAELLRAGLDLRDRHAAVEISRHGLAVARGRLENRLSDLIFPPKANAANERLAQHLWAHRDDLFTFLRQPGLDATNWRAELAIRFGVILRKVWGGSRTWIGARAQSVLMSVWRTCWQQGRSAPGFLSQLLRGRQVTLSIPP